MSHARLAVFGLMLAGSLAVLVASAADRHRRPGPAGERLEVASADLVASFGASRLRDPVAPPTDPLARQPLEVVLRRFQGSLHEHPDSEPLIRRIGVLIGVLQGPDAASKWFGTHPLPHPELWRAAYAPGALSASELEGALSTLELLPLSWYGDLVRARLYVKAGRLERAREVLDRLRERLQPDVARATALLGLAGVGVLIGVVVALVLGALALLGQLPRATRALPFSALSTQTLAEAFILWFFVLSVGGWGLRQALSWLLGPHPALPTAVQLALFLAVQAAAASAGWALLAAEMRHARPREPDGLIFDAPPASADTQQVDRGVRNAGWGILTYLAALPLLFLTAALLSRLLPDVPTPPNPAVNLALGARGIPEWVLLVVMVAVIGPLFEELFFRGVLYAALRKRLRPSIAILASATLFALVHPQLPLGFFPILVLGAAFAWAVELRRSLVPSIVAHMLNNAAAIVMVSLLRMP